jgi:hypothetical protein
MGGSGRMVLMRDEIGASIIVKDPDKGGGL